MQLGQKIKAIGNFRKSACYNIALNTLSGKYTRTQIFESGDNPTAMPRLGVVFNGEMYIVGKEDRMLGKSKIAVGKLSLKN